MIGAMIYKDFAIIKRTVSIYLLMMLLYFGMTLGGVFEGMEIMNSFAAMFSVSVPMGCFSLDEQARWEKYAVTLPLGRKGIVQAKYVLNFLLTAITSLFIIILNLVTFTLFPSRISSLPGSILSAIGVTVGCLLIHAVLTPAYLKFGVQKARMVILFAFAGIVAIFMSLQLMSFPARATVAVHGWSQATLEQVGAVVLTLLAVALLLLFVSYRISLRIYEKKEF